MTEESEQPTEANLFPKTIGERLRDARIAQKLELTDVAQRTRVPLRHLQAIEDGNYTGLPTPTYAVGFARAYARAVGADEVEVAREVRVGADANAAARHVPEYQPFDLNEAPRTPSGGILIAGVVLALLFVIGAGLWYGTTWFRGDGLAGDPTAATAPAFVPDAAPAPVASPSPAAAGQVALVAGDEVWVRVYDATGQTLLQKTMQPGERYDVPPGADRPMINIGRPDKLQILVDGRAVPPLGDGRVALKDVGIGAAALAARNPPAAGASPTPTPAVGATRRPTAGADANRGVPPFFRPAAQPTRSQAAPASTGQRDAEPAAATPAPAATAQAPGNGF